MNREDIIIGSGPTGLSLAWALLQKGKPCTLISQDVVAGGLSAPVHFAGRSFDFGPHSFYSYYSDEAKHLLHTCFRPEELWQPRSRRLLRLNAGIVSLPVRATDLLQPRVALLAMGALMPRASDRERPRHAADVVRKARGKAYLESVFEPWCMKHFGLPADQLDAGLPSQLATNRRSGPSSTLIHPRSGALGELWTRLADRLETRGTVLKWGERVSGLRTENGRVVQLITDKAAYKVDGRVFASLSAQALAKLLGNRTHEETRAYRHVTLVYLTVAAYRTDRLFITDHCMDELVCRVTFCDNWRPREERPLEPVVCAEFWHGTEKALPDTPALVELIGDHLRRTGTAVPSSAPHAKRFGPVAAIPVPLIDHTARNKMSWDVLTELKNLVPIGRAAAHRWDGIDDGILEAERLAMNDVA